MFSALVLAVAMHTPPLTGALYNAGGGKGDGFSTIRALGAMYGPASVQNELQKLDVQFGDTSTFVTEFDFAMRDAWQRASKSDVAVDSDESLQGQNLGNAIVKAGRQGRRFSVERLFGALFPPQLAGDVLLDVDTKYGTDQAKQFRAIADAFFEDIASER